MSIVSSDIELRISGGASNTDPNAALGGALSTVSGGLITTAVKNNLFDDVSSGEASSGDTEYRGVYAKNAHGTLTLGDARVYHSADSTSSSDVLDIGIAAEAVSTAMATIANESTAPTSITFSHPTTYAGGLALNSTTGLAAAAYKGIWVRRTISSSAAAGSITNNLKVEGTTS